MKNWSKLILALFAVGSAIGCSSDVTTEAIDGAQIHKEDKVYVSVAVTLPVGGGTSRSETSDPDNGTSSSTNGTEVGKDYENKVNRILLILATENNGYITYGTVDSDLKTSNTTVKATSKISKTELAAYYNTKPTDQKIRVFVICNYTDDLLNSFRGSGDQSGISLGDTQWINKICEVSETDNSIWQKNGMLMTNAVIATKMLPATLKEWDSYSSISTPLDLSINSSTSSGEILENNGAIRVERSMARLDFRDGSKNAESPNTYHVVSTIINKGEHPTDIVDIQLNRMALVNMSNKFYYFRRVTAAGATPGGVCLPELPWGDDQIGNYVEDVDFDTKAPGAAAYNYPLFKKGSETSGGVIDETARGQWYTSLISDVLKTDAENDNLNQEYKIWRYITENTVNNTQRMNAGLSTGVVFKGKMIPTQAALNSTDEHIAKLAKVLAYDMTDPSLGLNHNTNTDPILYTFGGNLYQHWPNMAQAAIDAATPEGSDEPVKTNSFYEAIFGTGDPEGENQDETSPNFLWHKWDDGGKTDVDLLAFKAAATQNGITLYQSSEDEKDGWGYYCYYFYWNRHNDNDKPGIMGEMEFAVVRNNVYKLAVTGISRLGHPRLSINDPDPVDPEEPDETGNVYISVAVEVLPWVVRVNDIEF